MADVAPPALVQFAQKAVIVENGRILMVRKAATDPYQAGKWELPGGRLEKSEGLDLALYREVWEEVGLAVEPGKPLALWQFRIAGISDVVAVARLCVAKTLDVNLHRGTHDHLDKYQWVEIHKILDLDLISSSREAMEMVVERLENVE